MESWTAKDVWENQPTAVPRAGATARSLTALWRRGSSAEQFLHAAPAADRRRGPLYTAARPTRCRCSRGRRPGPTELEPERRRLHLVPRKRQVAIRGFDVTTLGRPVRADDVLVEVDARSRRSAGVDVRRAHRSKRESAVGSQHATHFRMETLMIEPVRRLSGDDEIDAVIPQRRALGHVREIGHLRMLLGVQQLLHASIAGDHAIEMRRQADRRLAAAGRKIDVRARGAASATRATRTAGPDSRGDSAHRHPRAPRNDP